MMVDLLVLFLLINVVILFGKSFREILLRVLIFGKDLEMFVSDSIGVIVLFEFGCMFVMFCVFVSMIIFWSLEFEVEDLV